MHWASWNDFWAMGGSGRFVWGAYGMVALALAVEVALLRSRVRRARQLVRLGSDWSKKEMR